MRQLEQLLAAQQVERDQLRALQGVGAATNSSLDIDVVLSQVMDAIIRLTAAERAMLLLFNERGQLELKVARNIDRQTLEEEDSLAISRSVVDHVARTGQPVVTLNAQEDERFSEQHSVVSYKLRSILCVPLAIKGTPTGVIYVDNRIASGIFGEVEKDVLASFANQAAVAIANARLFQEIDDMKQLMDSVLASIASGVITIDDRGHIAFYNRAAERILGVLGSGVLGQPYDRVLSILGLPLSELIEQVQSAGEALSREFELKATSKRGQATVNLTLSPLLNLEGEAEGGVTLVIEEVTEKKRLESLRRYLPPALVDQVRDLDTAQLPQRRTITVLFADIRGFSRLGEQMDPELLIDLANGFFTEAVTAITENQGLIDKFTGDAVMALFNTPLNPQSDHAEKAVVAAVGIRQRLERHQADLPAAQRLHFGIGIHSGEAVVGNVGSEQRKDYSAVGDVVNLCKRLQELAEADQILLSREVYAAVREKVWVESLPPVQVKGRETREEVFRLVGYRPRG